MPPISRVSCVAAIGFLLLGLTGCGGSMPTTGETANLKPQSPEVKAAAKQFVQEFIDKAPAKYRAKMKSQHPGE